MKAAVISLGSTSSNLIIEEMKKLFDEVDHINIRDVEINQKYYTEVNIFLNTIVFIL